MLLLLMLVMLLGILFLSSMQPVMMVSSLVMMSLFYSFVVYKVMGSYWFSYALVMVMLSGILVVFTYMVSLIPNESFESYNIMFIFLVLFFVLVGGFDIMYFGNMSYLSMMMWSSYVSMYSLFMVGFLFSMMLMVVWMSCMMEGAIRVMYVSAWMKG